MPHIAISMYPGRSREEKAALAEKVRTLVSEELKKDLKVVTVSVHDVPAEKWQEHLDAIPGEEISAKIARMEMLIGRIFDRVEQNPQVGVAERGKRSSDDG